ncbi:MULTISPECIES: hypothetical protein [unclassified Streptomyces]|uniref:hypothetical protein n=1 Tax=unclassified Streptomyces TaxID=2593676 RepID=UPI00225A082F|nr:MULTISPECIES: hypothetical protein [unclassified Streptomyces]MCX5049789.1 hypothetical protein [Streptomyces sp. NBC_00474]
MPSSTTETPSAYRSRGRPGRTGFGGSLDNRIRFAVEVATAPADEIGADRAGFRVPPGNPFNDIAENDSHEPHPALARAPTPLDLAYLHIGHGGDELLHARSKLWPNTLVLNRAGTDIATRAKGIEDALADIVNVGVMALADPDHPTHTA